MHEKEFMVIARSMEVTHGIPAGLLAGFAFTESGFEEYAWNPEPHYRYLWDVRKNAPFRKLSEAERKSEVPPPDFPVLGGDRDQEWWAQQASWGLFQVMGAVAREVGFKAKFLPSLMNPMTNFTIACLFLGKLRTRFVEWPRVISAYNAGTPTPTNQEYVNKVLSAAQRYGFTV